MARADVRLSRRAFRDLDAIADYVAQTGGMPKTALAYIDRIYERCLALGDFPQIGRPFTSARGSLRTLPFEGVIIVYRETALGVRVVAIFNQRQDYRKQLLRLG